MDFYSAYRHGFVRVAACTHHAVLADPAGNAESVVRLARACHDDGVAVAVFPELTLSGYSIEDILLQDTLLDAVEDALLDVVAASADLLPVLVVGAPLRYLHRIYNTAVVIHRGAVLGVAPGTPMAEARLAFRDLITLQRDAGFAGFKNRPAKAFAAADHHGCLDLGDVRYRRREIGCAHQRPVDAGR